MLIFVQKLEERYKNEKKTQQALQSRILELQAEVEILKKKQPGRGQLPRLALLICLYIALSVLNFLFGFLHFSLCLILLSLPVLFSVSFWPLSIFLCLFCSYSFSCLSPVLLPVLHSLCLSSFVSLVLFLPVLPSLALRLFLSPLISAYLCLSLSLLLLSVLPSFSLSSSIFFSCFLLHALHLFDCLYLYPLVSLSVFLPLSLLVCSCLYLCLYVCVPFAYACSYCLWLCSVFIILTLLFFPAPPRSTHSTAVVSGTGTDPEHATSTGSPAEYLRAASDCPSDHSITDSPAHLRKK